ncbi:MAG: hypothetical protein HUU28_06765 [Planctomycetaceae bacterium]|nr:hypothetical protein [Planctomycetaceae bacterium]
MQFSRLASSRCTAALMGAVLPGNQPVTVKPSSTLKLSKRTIVPGRAARRVVTSGPPLLRMRTDLLSTRTFSTYVPGATSSVS